MEDHLIDIHSVPQPAAQRSRWQWQCASILFGALLAILLLSRVAQAQAEPPPVIRYTLGQQLFGPDPAALNDAIQFNITITNTGDITITHLPLTYTFASQYLTLLGVYPFPDSDNSAGQLKWNNLAASCPHGLAPHTTCVVSGGFTAKQDTTLLRDQRTVNTAQTAHQQSTSSLRIDASLVRYTVEQQPFSQSAVPGSAISFTILISNTSGALIRSLPLTYTYDARALIFVDATPPADQSSAGELQWRNLAVHCGGALWPQAGCAVVVAFVTLHELGSTHNSVQSSSQPGTSLSSAPSTAEVNIVAQARNLVPLSPFNPWIARDQGAAHSIAWGDVDGDGDLDLAAGIPDNPTRLYLNEGGGLQSVAAWRSAAADTTTSVAWGDVDGDGDLDLAVGNGCDFAGCDANKLYVN